MIADFNPKTGQLDIYNGNQAPHAHRTVYAHVAGLAEHMIRIRCSGHRRRLRQQGAGVSRLRVRDRRLDRRRRAGQVGREPLREPDVHRVRPRLHHAQRDVREGRQDHRPAGRRDRRPRRVRHAPRSRRSSRPGSSTSSAARTTSRRRTSRSRPSTRTRRRAASRTAARSASPRPCTSSSAWSTRSRSR